MSERTCKFNFLDKVRFTENKDWKDTVFMINGIGIYPHGLDNLVNLNSEKDRIVLFLSREVGHGKWKQVLTFVNENELELVEDKIEKSKDADLLKDLEEAWWGWKCWLEMNNEEFSREEEKEIEDMKNKWGLDCSH